MMIEALHIELTNRCNLKCTMCPRTRDGVGKIEDIRPEAFENLQLETFKTIVLVGCVGDSLYYKHLRQFFLHAKNVNKDIKVHFATNGVGKKEQWWRKLSLYMPENHKIIFGIDGIDNETLNRYRVGSNYDRVIRNMRSFIDGGGHADWQFILFKHNEHQVDGARELANKYGASFSLRSSYYYSENKKYALRPTRDVETQMEISMKLPQNSRLACRIEDNKEIFVDYRGMILPCCLTSTKASVANRLTRGIIFNIHDYPIRKCISDHYINGILKIANNYYHCTQRCKVGFDSVTLERREPNDYN